MNLLKLFIVSFFFCYSAKSQIYQPINTPLKWKIGGFDSMFIPSHDTIKPSDKTKAWITLKNGALFNWNTSLNKWDSLKGGSGTGGGGGTGETTSGTVAELRALSTTTGRNYTSTDRGGGQWVDIGLSDGAVDDDGATYIITANNHLLREDNYYRTKEIDVKKYGLPCDGSLHTISSLLPAVTLSQVQAFDAAATLSSSADWYIMSLLLKKLPVQSTIVISGAIVIDREIIIKRGAFEIKGINSAVADKFANNKSKIIQVGNGKDVFKVIDGDGTTYGYGVGQVNNIKFTNIIVEGTMNAANQSGNGFGFYLSPEGVTGTAINWSFTDVSVRGCLNGFKHFTGHINDFFFDRCDFSINFNAGFVLSGNSQNQANYFTFTNTSFNANGYKIVGSSLVDYVQDTANPNYTKGGFICTQVVALTMTGISSQSNKGFGIDLGPGAHLGVDIGGYAEANTLGDLRIANDSSYNINVIAAGLYSRDRTYIIPNTEVRKRALVLLGSEWNNQGNNLVSVPAGNVGVGTNIIPPLSKFDIASLQDTTYMRVRYGSTSNGTQFGWNNATGRGEIKTSSSSYPFEILPGGIRKMQVNQNGVTIGVDYVAAGVLPPPDGLVLQGRVSAAKATQPTDLLRKDQLDSLYGASTFIMRNALGAGDTIMKIVIPGSHVAFKRVIMNGIISKAITDTTITYNIGGTGVNGTVSFTGNGSSTSFTIPLSSVAGLSSTSKVFLQAYGATVGAAIDHVDATTESIIIYYLTAPTSGAKTLNYFIVP